MKHMVCSKMWTDINIRVPQQSIVNCCKKTNQKVTIDEINEKGTQVFLHRKKEQKEKKFFVKQNNFPDGCKECALNHPDSLWSVWNTWKNYNFTQSDLIKLQNPNYDTGRHIEIMLSNTCNMTCMYCNGYVSSMWSDIDGLKNNNTDEDIWKTKILDNLYKYIRKSEQWLDYNFIGGEPLLDPMFTDVFKNIIDAHKNSNAKFGGISLTTNLNVKPKVLENFLDMWKDSGLKNLRICPSIDAMGNEGSTIREGLIWERFWKNAETILQDSSVTSVSWLPTISALSVPYHYNMIKTITDISIKNRGNEKWELGHNYVNEPAAMSPRILPLKYKTEINKTIDYLESLNIEHNIHHINLCKNVAAMLGTNRKSDQLQKAKDWYILQGGMKQKDYFVEFPWLGEVLNGLE